MAEKRKRKALEQQKQEALEKQRLEALEKKRRLRTMALAAAFAMGAIVLWLVSRPSSIHGDASVREEAGVVALPSVDGGGRAPQGLASHLAAQTSSLGADVVVYRVRDDQSSALKTEDTIKSGDVLHVTVTQPTSGRVAAWFVDAGGRIERVVPPGIIVLPAGRASIPGKATVATPCADMDVVALIGAPHSLVEIEQHMREGLDAGATQRTGDAWLPPGALRRHLRCE